MASAEGQDRIRTSLGLWPMQVLGLTLAYAVAARFALMLAVPPAYAAPVWPPAGIALAALLVFGWRAWPGVWLGSLTGDLWNHLAVGSASDGVMLVHSAVAVGVTLQALACSFLVRRFVGFPNPLLSERDVAGFFVLAGPVGCTVSASFALPILLWSGRVEPSEMVSTWLTWWAGDAVGTVVVAPLLLIVTGQTIRRVRRLSIALPLLVLLALNLLSYGLVTRHEDQRMRLEFESRAGTLLQNLQHRLDVDFESLSAIARLYASTQDVTRDGFRRFVEAEWSTNPGIETLLWIPRVTNDHRAGLEDAARADGLLDFAIREIDAAGKLVPAAERTEYFPVFYSEPRPHESTPLGYDLAADPFRLDVLQRARDTGQPAATDCMILPGADRARSFLVCRPIFTGETEPADREQRRARLLGFALGVFRVDDLLASALTGLEPVAHGIEIRVHDEAETDGSLTWQTAATAEAGGLATMWTFEVADRRWTLSFVATPAYLAAHRTWLSWASLLVGLLVTSLVAFFLFVVTGRTARIEQVVAERTAELSRANQAAQSANRAKGRFLANISHEIRSPMTAILGFAETLLEPGLGEEEAAQAAACVHRNARHLLTMLNDVLDMSKIESGKMSIDLVQCSLRDVLADVYSMMRARAVRNGLSFEVEFSGPVPSVMVTDPTRIRQILVNLVGNAIKFTDNGGVRMVVASKPGASGPVLQIDVVDTGIGIDAAEALQLFQPFVQAESTALRRLGGTGLGLAISKELAEMLGGDVRLVRTETGSGSTFRLTLAAGPLPAGAMIEDTRGADFLEGPELGSNESLVPSGLGGRVLLAEDRRDNQLLIRRLLEKGGAEVVIVGDGEQAVTAALAAAEEGRPFDLLLMDMQMPVLDGYEATVRLRREGYSGAIVALTANAFEGDDERCIDAGCDGYLAKPIERARFFPLLRAHLPGTG